MAAGRDQNGLYPIVILGSADGNCFGGRSRPAASEPPSVLGQGWKVEEARLVVKLHS
jgi:hypothetical protein